MLKLFTVQFYVVGEMAASLQAVIVSERTKTLAKKRAKAFVLTQYKLKLREDHTQFICMTPDDVLDWL